MPRPEGRSQSTGLSLGKIFPSRPISVFPNQGPATGHSWIILFGLTQCRATAMTTGSMVHRTSDALLCRCMTVQRTLHLLTLAFIIRIVGTLASTSQACLKAELENICNMANTQKRKTNPNMYESLLTLWFSTKSSTYHSCSFTPHHWEGDLQARPTPLHLL